MKKKITAVLLICVCLAGAVWCFNPKVRTNVFVALHSSSLEEAYQPGVYPARIGDKYLNDWPGEHPMAEFTLSTFGLVPSTGYYGCYYSPDDVPRPFQNAPVPLVQTDDGRWEWTGEGDNHGTTSKIKDGWYYFEAHF